MEADLPCGLISGYTAELAAFAKKESLTKCVEQTDIVRDFLEEWEVSISGYTAGEVAVSSLVSPS
jgi:hypothetical protein